MTRLPRNWTRPLVIIAVALLAVAGIGTFIAFTGDDHTDTTVATAPQTTSAAPSASGAIGLPQYGHVDTQADVAVRAMHEYPEYYPAQCKAYPAADVIQPIDAMPFANVISTLTYNPAKSIYVVAHDPRMTVTYTITNEKGDGDEQYRAQNFTFSFAAGVHYFRAYDGSGNNGYWSGTPALFAPNYHAGYTLSLSLDKVAAQQESPVAVLATDTTNCTPSSTALPSDFNWAKLASNGLFTPEYYEQRVGHPQG